MTIVAPSTLINGPGWVASALAAGAITPIQVQGVVSSLAGAFVSSKSGSYTLVAADFGTIIEVNVTAPATAIVFRPTNATVPFDVNACFEVFQAGTGTVGIAAVTPSVTTIVSPTGTYITSGQYSSKGSS